MRRSLAYLTRRHVLGGLGLAGLAGVLRVPPRPPPGHAKRTPTPTTTTGTGTATPTPTPTPTRTPAATATAAPPETGGPMPNLPTMGTPVATPINGGIRVEWPYTGDDDNNATCTYALADTPTGTYGTPVAMTRDGTNKKFTADITFTGTKYIKLDPDDTEPASGYTTRYDFEASAGTWRVNNDDGSTTPPGTGSVARVSGGYGGSAWALKATVTGLPTGGYAQFEADTNGAPAGTASGNIWRARVQQVTAGGVWYAKPVWVGPSPNFTTYGDAPAVQLAAGQWVTVAYTAPTDGAAMVNPANLIIRCHTDNNLSGTAEVLIDLVEQQTS
jgi:hypothetical protein